MNASDSIQSEYFVAELLTAEDTDGQPGWYIDAGPGTAVDYDSDMEFSAEDFLRESGTDCLSADAKMIDGSVFMPATARIDDALTALDKAYVDTVDEYEEYARLEKIYG